MYFPVAGIEVSPLLPPAVAFAISLVTAPAGVTGAFLLLPFQVSVLGFTSPAVSPTNLLYNVVATPTGVYRYIKEGRMTWSLALTIAAGTVSGVFLGVIIRVRWLPDPARFKVFIGAVLLYLGASLLYKSLRGRGKEPRMPPHGGAGAVIRSVRFTPLSCELHLWGERYTFNPVLLFGISFVIGVIGGSYGIGGGAILAPLCAVYFGLPLYAVAGATILGTFLTSVVGVLFYTVLAPAFAPPGTAVSPDWLLGFMLGIGGTAGMYCGARLQKHIPEKAIRLVLGALILGLSLKYLTSPF